MMSRTISGMLIVALAIGAASLAHAQEGDDELVGFVVGLLADKDKDIRALGFEQVRSAAKGDAATKKFAEQLATISADAQVGLLSALADRGDAAARPYVVALLDKSDDDSVRVAAIKALGPLGSPEDAERLIKLMSEPAAELQSSARKSLTDLRGDAVSSVIANAAKVGATDNRVALIKVLAARRAFDTVPALLEFALDTDVSVRKAAMKVLSELAGPEHIAGMVQGVLKTADSSERAAAEKCVMFACARIEDPERRADPLLAALDKLSEGDQLKMLSTLGRVGGDKALAVIEKAIADENERTHEIGVKALCNWPTASVAPRLMELAQSDDHSAHKIAALRALIRVAPLRDDRSIADRLQILEKAMIMATRDDERTLALDRARGIRTVASLNFILPYTDNKKFAERACLSIVELAHHRGLRVPNQAVFDKALDKVIATSKDTVVVDRAKRYKKDETWVRPK